MKRLMQIVVELRTDKTPQQLEAAMRKMLREKQADVAGVGVIECGNDFIALRERWVRPDMPQQDPTEGVPDLTDYPSDEQVRSQTSSDGWVEPDPRIPDSGARRGDTAPSGPRDQYAVDDGLIMNFGKFKGRRIGDVPAKYLLWFHGQPWAPQFPYVYAYCCRNWSLLDEESGATDGETFSAPNGAREAEDYFGYCDDRG